MHIEQMRGWDDPGYLESDYRVPYNTEMQIPHTWELQHIYPSVEALFKGVRLVCEVNGDIEKYRNTKYIRVKYSNFSYPIYGWVDEVSFLSAKTMALIWHPDYWRTYYRKAQVRGWIKRRPPADGDRDRDPYHIIPAFSNHAGVEEIPIGFQRRGVAWVFLYYITDDQKISHVVNAGAQAIPGGNEAGGFVQGIFHAGMSVADNLINLLRNGAPNLGERGDVGYQLPMPDTYPMRCVFYPVSVEAYNRAYFKPVNASFQRLMTWSPPTLAETINGVVSKTFSIKPGNMIGAYITPVCPLYDVGGLTDDGTLGGRPIKLATKPNVHLDIPRYNNQRNKLLSADVQGYTGFMKIKRYGIRNVGDMREGCPRLEEVLTEYYTGDYQIPDMTCNIDGMDYTVKIEKNDMISTPLTTELRFMLIPLRAFLNVIAPTWRRYPGIDISQITYAIPGGIVQYHMTRIMYVKDDLPADDKPKWRCHRQGNTFIWKYEATRPVVYEDLGSKFMATLKPTTLNMENDGFELHTDNPLFQYSIDRTIDELYIGVIQPRNNTWPVNAYYFRGLRLEIRDPAADYKVAQYRSLANWDGLGALSSQTTSFPMIHLSLDKEYWTDDYHDLVLVGPDGSALYRFKTGVKIKDYSYQICINATPAYIKLRFSETDRAEKLSDREVHVPLSTMTAFGEYLNPFTNLPSMVQQRLQNAVENEEYDRHRLLKRHELELQYEKEDTGLWNVATRWVADLGNKLGALLESFTMDKWNIFSSEKGGITGVDIISAFQNLVGYEGKRDREVFYRSSSEPKQDPVKNAIETAGATAVAGLHRTVAENELIHTKRTFRQKERQLMFDTWAHEDWHHDKVHNIGAVYAPEPAVKTSMSMGDFSWFHEFGSLRLVYVTKDDYSINRYHETAKITGIEVSEVIKDFVGIPPGPIKVEPCMIRGRRVPKHALEYIKGRLEAGVYVDKDL